jgi:hypothetical protein
VKYNDQDKFRTQNEFFFVKFSHFSFCLKKMSKVFEDDELVAAMKIYLSKTVTKDSTFTQEEAQEWDGMCLRKSSLCTILQHLVLENFLRLNKNGKMELVNQNDNAIDENYCELFPEVIIVDKMLSYLKNRFQNDQWWSEGDMQLWDGMCLRKRVIVDCLYDLVEQSQIVKGGPFMYKLQNP